MKEILLLAETRGTADYVHRQLREIFSPFAKLSVVIAGENLPSQSLSASLVVIISKVLEDQMQKYIKPGTPLLIADRMIDPCEAAQLYEIPGGSEVLVVNTSPKVTAESIQQLIAFGIDGLQYHAYYPGIAAYPTDCRYVVTFGESHLIPPGAYEQVLDLHSRPVGISTCVRIADELGIYDQLREILSSLYMNPLVRTTRDLAVTGFQNKQFSESLQKIIDLFQDGVVVLDQERQIIFYNDIARRILNIRRNESHTLDQILSEHSLSDFFFHKLRGSNYYFEPVTSRLDREQSTILTIRDVKKIEHIENSYRRTLAEKGLVARYTFRDLIYRSASMETVVQTAERFAQGESTIFIHGPSGSGKEMLAQAIHNASPRKSHPFVAINFASLSPSLSESELFGYEEGAFTGARRGGRQGLFQLAHCGTIFLDEIGDAPLEIQKKLLRVLQERTVLPVGGSRLIPVDVRIIAASNQDMEKLIDSHQFREDLYYRLNVLPLSIPPLRQRKEDILPLFLHFLQNEFGISVDGLEVSVQRELEQYSWNGNVRELRNAAEYVSNFAPWDPHWQSRVHAVLPAASKIPAPCTPPVPENSGSPSPSMPAAALLHELEKHGDIRSFHRILSVLDLPPYRWSRQSIARHLADSCHNQEEDPAPSDSQIKRDLLLMKKLELVNAVTGKGTFLKEGGRRLLQQLDQAASSPSRRTNERG